jgi:hypothetical protein
MSSILIALGKPDQRLDELESVGPGSGTLLLMCAAFKTAAETPRTALAPVVLKWNLKATEIYVPLSARNEE